jgi:4-azaleucine resistance transporter AzlC
MKYRKDLAQGIKSGLPIAMGYFPIAIAFGALAIQAQLTWFEATLMSIIVYAGASQFVSVSLILAGAGAGQIITTTFFVNFRHLIMSMAVHDQIKDFSRSWKTLLSFGITDETFALLSLGGSEDKDEISLTPFYTAGLMSTAYLGWILGTIIGGFGASFIPVEITTAITVGLFGLFIGLLVPPAKKAISFAVIALMAMVLNTLLRQVLDPGWSVVISTILAATGGIFLIEEQA